MTPRQWGGRILFEGKKRMSFLMRLRAHVPSEPTIIGVPFFPAPSGERALSKADELLEGRFAVLNGITLRFHGDIDWAPGGAAYRLPYFRLNAFGFLEVLSDAYQATRARKYIEKGVALMDDWWRRNGRAIGGTPWDAYVVADRISQWIAFFSAHADFFTQPEEWVRRIAVQARYLRKNVEFHLGANHLLSEARALAFAGVFLKDAALREYGLRLLEDEYAEQFLEDGGHYERSLSYQIEAMQQYLEVMALLRWMGDARWEAYAARLHRPFCFLRAAMGPDLSIPLVNDASSDYPFPAADFYACASRIYGDPGFPALKSAYADRWLGCEWTAAPPGREAAQGEPFQRATGYLFDATSFGERRQFLFMDAGDMGPDYNLGHAHADSLSVLWSVDGERILVDAGTFSYMPGEKRAYYRSTRAHNTVEIDGTDSAEVWGAFRVGRRGHAKLIRYENDGRSLRLTAAHDGYEVLLKPPVRHVRMLERDAGAIGFRIIDELQGAGKHRYASRLHFAPGIELECAGPNEVLVAGKYRIRASEAMTLTRMSVSEKFGEETWAACVEIGGFFSGTKRITVAFDEPSFTGNTDEMKAR